MTDPILNFEWICDSCAKQKRTEVKDPGIPHTSAPDGWVRLGVLTRDGLAQNDFRWICDDCAGFVRKNRPGILGLDPS